MNVEQLIAKLRREARPENDGWNERTQTLITWLQQGDVDAGLHELARAVPQLPRHWLAEVP
jgi:hypothetical protein